MTILKKRAINKLMLGVLGNFNLAEIIPFEPETVKADEGKCKSDRALVIKIFNFNKP